MSEWWRGAVIYQIYPRSFQDSNGDGIGDLPGVIDRLDHIARLGVDAIWLSPFFTSPMADMGYDVSDHKNVDPCFGQLEDVDALIERAHALGLKVIIDQVISHTSDQHPWFQESRVSNVNARADWYVWADPKPDGTPPNNWISVFGGPAWTWNATRRQFYLHNFLASQPDLNFHNPDVQDAMLDVMRFWLERGVDGFRFDTVNYYFHDQELRSNPPEPRPHGVRPSVNPYEMQDHFFSKSRPENIAFLRRIRTVMDTFGATTTVGEIGEGRRAVQVMADYTAGNDKLHMAYSFDMLGPEFTAAHFRSRVENFFAGGGGWPCWSFSNHDVNRHASRWTKYAIDHEALVRQTAVLLLTLKGSVGLYQGEELGLPEADLLFEELTDPPGISFWPEYKGRDGCRTPMPWDEGAAPNGFTSGVPWLPVKPSHSTRAVAIQERNEASSLKFYRQALAFRRAHSELKTGDIVFHDIDEPILAFTRTLKTQAMLCVFNLSPQPHNILIQGLGAHARLGEISDAAQLENSVLKLAANGMALIKTNAKTHILSLKLDRAMAPI